MISCSHEKKRLSTSLCGSGDFPNVVPQYLWFDIGHDNDHFKIHGPVLMLV